jgi:hypothetical protein
MKTMLTVNIKCIAGELTPGFKNGEYEIEEGVTVKSLLDWLACEFGVTIPPNNLKLMYLLFDGKPIQLFDPITKSGTLHICRIVVGG